MKVSLAQAMDALLKAQNIIISTHVNPDGDAIGSSLALCHFLRGQKKAVRVIIDDKFPREFTVLPGNDLVETFDPGMNLEADLLVVLDANLGRLGKVGEAVKAPQLNIDHHITNDLSADMFYVDADRAATSEIMFQLFKETGKTITSAMAACLYTGIATDTGFFRYSNTTPHVMRAAAELIELGAKPNVISEAIEIRPFELVKGQAAAIQTVETFADGKIAGLFIDRELASQLSTTEGFIENVRIIEGVDVAFMVKYKDENSCRVSMRSKYTNVSKIAASFGGGGHVKAAGCTLNMTFAEAKKTILTAIEGALGNMKADS